MIGTQLPQYWEWKPIGDVAKVVPGYAFKSKDWTDQGVQVVKIKNIQSDTTVNMTEADCVPEEILTERLAKFLLSDGDILLAMTGATAGKVGKLRTNQRALLNQRVAKLVPVTVDEGFFWSVVSSQDYQDYFFKLADGAAQPNMSGGQIEKVAIPFPPLSTQRRIASTLSTYDDLIENNTRRIAVLEEMARRLYEEWFVHFRFPGHEDATFTETEQGRVPEGWKVKPLGDACERITDGAHKSPPSVEHGRPMASVKDMHEWGLHLNQCRHISEEDYGELVRNNCKPELNDILIAKDGANLNKHTFLITEEVDVVLLSSVAILRPGDEVHPEFLTAQLKSSEVSNRIKQSKSGAAIPRIVLKDFKRLEILVPSRQTQGQWNETAGPLAGLCRTLVKRNANLRAQRDLLLPKLVSGEIDVSEAEETLEDAVA